MNSGDVMKKAIIAAMLVLVAIGQAYANTSYLYCYATEGPKIMLAFDDDLEKLYFQTALTSPVGIATIQELNPIEITATIPAQFAPRKFEYGHLKFTIHRIMPAITTTYFEKGGKQLKKKPEFNVCDPAKSHI